jgi:hypothetical protein
MIKRGKLRERKKYEKKYVDENWAVPGWLVMASFMQPVMGLRINLDISPWEFISR